MRRQLLNLVLGIALLLLAALLAARGAGPVGAAALPPLAQPASAHLQLDGTVEIVAPAGRQTLVIGGEGDYDRARRAFRFAGELRDTSPVAGGPGSVPIGLVQVDDRLYVRDRDGAGWTWLPAPRDGAAGVDPFTNVDGGFATAGLDFARVGPDLIAGAATTHWRAAANLDDLLRAANRGTPVPSGPGAPAMTFTIDLWRGDDDAYLHRLAWSATFGGTDESGQAVALTVIVTATFSDFDQPATIVAPPDARPADLPPGTTLPGSFSTLIGGDLGGALPLQALGLELPDIGGVAPGGTGAGGRAARAASSATPGRPSFRVVAEPTSSVTRPAATATVAPTRTPTAPRPTNTPPRAAAAATGAAQPTAVPAIGALQSPPATAAPSRGAQPVLLGVAALGGVLVLASGLLLLTRRSPSRR